MFERFTDRARRVNLIAQQFAGEMRSEFIGTEHLLLALLFEGGGIAAKVLTELGLEYKTLRATIEPEDVPLGEGRERVPYNADAKKTLELSLREALLLGHNYIGTEHILLGLLRQQGTACRLLADAGLPAAEVRQKVIEVLSGLVQKSEPNA